MMSLLLYCILPQLADKWRKIRIAADDDKSIDMRFRVAEVKCIDDHPNVCRVLARLAHMRNVDELKCRLMHGGLEVLVTLPVAISLLYDNAAFNEQAFKNFIDVKLRVFSIPNAKRDILEIAEHGEVIFDWTYHTVTLTRVDCLLTRVDCLLT